jgi:hypothetical protein
VVGHGQSEEQAEQRCLPGPVRPNQSVYFSLGDVDVDVVEGDDFAEGLADSASANCKRLGQGGPAGDPAGPPVVSLFGCFPEARQFVSELGM